ncbi:AIR synthase family protein [bacterium]|nr:AIR synthase family protein [bacterium]
MSADNKRLPDLGKVTPEFFDRVIFPRLGAADPDVLIGPRHGVDFAAITLGDQIIVLSTDPFFIAPALGLERAAWFALHILASDVAVSGIPPRFFAVDLNLPPEMREDELTTMWQTVHEEAERLGIAIVAGHTARYAGCNFPMVGGATVFGVGSKEQLIDPREAATGDRIIITKGPAIEATGLMAVQFPEFIDERYGEAFTKQAQDMFFSMSVVKDARICAEIGGMTAMHDATECGIWGALFEIARASEQGMIVNKADIVTDDVALKVCDLFGMDPMSSISEGTLVGTVHPSRAAEVLSALGDAGIPASDVGELVSIERGVRVVEEGVESVLEHPGTDPFWGTFEEYLGKQAARSS